MDEPQPTCSFASAPVGATVWYRTIADGEGTLRVSTAGSGFDTVVALYTGSALDTLEQIACSDDAEDMTSVAVAAVTPGTEVAIQVGGWHNAAGKLSLSVRSSGTLNDTFANAIAVNELPFAHQIETHGAETEPGEPLFSCAPTGSTVWYALTLPETSTVVAHTFGSDFDTVLSVFIGSSLQSLDPVACNDDWGSFQSRVAFPAQAGVTYHLQAGGFGGDTGLLALTIEPGPPGPPNDAFADAIEFTEVPSGHDGDTTFASLEPGEPQPSCTFFGAPIGNSVWYRLTTATPVPVVATTKGSLFDTVIGVYTGSEVGSLTEVACGEDSGVTLTSKAGWIAQPGVTYHIQVAGWFGDAGLLRLRLRFGAHVEAPLGGGGVDADDEGAGADAVAFPFLAGVGAEVERDHTGGGQVVACAFAVLFGTCYGGPVP